MEELGVNTNNGNCKLEQRREEVTGLGEGLPDGVSDSCHHGTDHCQGEMLWNVEPEPGLRAEEPGRCNHRELHAAAEMSHTGDMAVGDAETENGSTQLGQCNESLSLRREPGELPRGVTDDEPAILEPGKDEQVESVAGCDSTKCLCLCDGKGLRDARASRTV
ncbi:hypothetical protein ACFX13_000842 [Malus domestica]